MSVESEESVPVENLNMDFRVSVILETEDMEWSASPSQGIERLRLEREFAESGRATSIVRYLPGTSFPQHVHSGGEEYFVLRGTFSDGEGDFPEGFYVRNSPGSRHAPFSREGCTIFVKLGQMEPDEEHVVVDSRALEWGNGLVEGHSVAMLYQNSAETVTLEQLHPQASLGPRPLGGGEELFILQGKLEINGKPFARGTWCRTPAGAPAVLSSSAGCKFWTKRLSTQVEALATE